MLVSDFRILNALTAILTGAGALLLGLAALDLASARCVRLWLLASPQAARQARFGAALAAYRGRPQKPVRRTG